MYINYIIYFMTTGFRSQVGPGRFSNLSLMNLHAAWKGSAWMTKAEHKHIEFCAMLDVSTVRSH